MLGRPNATRPRLWALALALITLPEGRARAGFTITDLGVLATNQTSSARAINAIGGAAGQATLADGTQVAAKFSGGVQDVSPGGAQSSLATGINLNGDVSGSVVLATDQKTHAFSIVNGKFQQIGPLSVDGHDGMATQASGINASGESVGTGTIPGRDINGVYTPLSSIQTAFRATASGTPTVIQTLGSGLSNYGNGINDQGTIVGSSEISPNGPVHAFLATEGGPPVDLIKPNTAGNFTNNSEANAINSMNDVVGDGVVGNQTHAFFASHAGGNLVDLGVGGGNSSIAHALNALASPLVVGEVDYASNDIRAFLWQAGAGMVDLRSLLAPLDQATWGQLVRAWGINDSNQIVGEGLRNGQMHGFLLTPVQGQAIFTPATAAVPAPPASAMVAIGCGIAALVAGLRRGRTSGRAVA